jgi:uncharacterized membrane protein YbhN (UPF0104 family)
VTTRTSRSPDPDGASLGEGDPPDPGPVDPRPARRLARIAAWIVAVAVAIWVLDLLGIPVHEWIDELFDKLGEVPPWAIVAAVILQSAQTAMAALAWFGILRAMPPGPQVRYRVVLASYATAVALNSFLPANIGTWVMLVMFTVLFAGATFPMMLSGLVVQKVPFTVFSLALYLYLFLSVAGSFSVKLGFLSEHTGLILGILIGGLVLIALLGGTFRRRLAGLRSEVAGGGAVIRTPRRFLARVLAPSLGSYLARLAIVAIFLGAYGIPVTFHNVATVTASNSISNSVSATPGGVGVTQALNATALAGSTDAATATAYSIAQQVVTSAWNVLFGLILVSWVFGWRGGNELVRSSYTDAKSKSREFKEAHRRKPRADQTGGR